MKRREYIWLGTTLYRNLFETECVCVPTEQINNMHRCKSMYQYPQQSNFTNPLFV